MKIITLQRLTENGEPVYGEEGDIRDWFCVIETKEEEALYDMAMGERKPLQMAEEDMPIDTLKIIWDDLVCFAGAYEGVSWGDDDIYYYFRPDDKVPEVGEQWTDDDGDRWGRVR